jgi:hypothetical protein
MNDVDPAKYIGDTIARVCRLKYQIGQEIVFDDSGAVEITFAGGPTFFCDSGPDGDSVRIHDDAWIDPFAEPLSPANEDYVRTPGKWTKFDVSDEAPFAHLVGRKLIDAAPMSGATGKLYGLLLNVSGYLLAVYANTDELHVRLLT